MSKNTSLIAACAAAAWLAALCLAPATALAQARPAAAPAELKRVALVVGNARYTGVPVLVNTLNDADDMCKALRELKFEVLCVRDLKSRRDFKRAVQDFTSKLGTGVAGLFYYAGHGLQIDGENYLVPTDARIDKKEDVEDETVSLRYVMAALDEARADFSFIILDACRNSPFTRGFTRAVNRGLAAVSDTPTGSLVLYSTAANDTASDGPSGQRNSPFTKHLLTHMKQPGLTVEAMIKKVSAGVQNDTQVQGGKRQVPFSYGSFTGEFCFAGCASPTEQAETARLRKEREALEKAQAELALREAELKRATPAPVPPPAEPAPQATRTTAPKPAPRPVVVPSF
ncbi:caspase family protein [Rhizobacter sp. J219]|uniref:caspase family protein n=1 Tax=Rhizobacter sp. J219 TaxID=2898430 RepID=UPI002151BEBE|nr:caspase family protein [Rhizobacter sp. J219]MCR5884873.1 caspase family protein [Rhizobacter sp. J219]